MIIFRLQNVCHCVELGEWPSVRLLSMGLPAASESDTRCGTPETPPSRTPALSEDGSNRDVSSPFAATVIKNNLTMQNCKLWELKIHLSRSPKLLDQLWAGHR